MKKILFVLLLFASLSSASFVTITALKACTNSTNATGSCANTDVLNPSLNFTVQEAEAGGAPFNATISIENQTILNIDSNITISIYARYQATPTPHTITISIWNTTNWVYQRTIEDGGFQWYNITLTDINYWKNGNLSVLFNHAANSNSAHVGLIVDYFAIAAESLWLRIDNLAITPTNPTTEDNLNCVAQVCSIFNSTISLRGYWYKNTLNQTDLAFNTTITNNTQAIISTLAKGNLTAGNNWYCRIYAQDLYSNNTKNSASVYIDEDLPTLDDSADALIVFVIFTGLLILLTKEEKHADE